MSGLMDPEDGENRAVRCFLMQYGVPGLTVEAMKRHMIRCGFPFWPEWAQGQDHEHLTKGGAQSWLRHLFALESADGVEVLPPGAEPSPEGFGKVDLTGIKRGPVRTPVAVKRGPVRTPGVAEAPAIPQPVTVKEWPSLDALKLQDDSGVGGLDGR